MMRPRNSVCILKWDTGVTLVLKSFQTIENREQEELSDRTGVMLHLLSESTVTPLCLSYRFSTGKSMGYLQEFVW